MKIFKTFFLLLFLPHFESCLFDCLALVFFRFSLFFLYAHIHTYRNHFNYYQDVYTKTKNKKKVIIKFTICDDDYIFITK
jgi:hypothetical protein